MTKSRGSRRNMSMPRTKLSPPSTLSSPSSPVIFWSSFGGSRTGELLLLPSPRRRCRLVSTRLEGGAPDSKGLGVLSSSAVTPLARPFNVICYPFCVATMLSVSLSQEIVLCMWRVGRDGEGLSIRSGLAWERRPLDVMYHDPPPSLVTSTRIADISRSCDQKSCDATGALSTALTSLAGEPLSLEIGDLNRAWLTSLRSQFLPGHRHPPVLLFILHRLTRPGYSTPPHRPRYHRPQGWLRGYQAPPVRPASQLFSGADTRWRRLCQPQRDGGQEQDLRTRVRS